MSKSRHFFAGANSGSGFISCFNYVNEDRAEGMLYILKGSPGSGKSTLVKRIAKHFEEKGIDVERFYCSSDPDSLDGVRLPAYNIAVVDGTAPHTLDCSMPAMKERIVDLGVYIGKGMKQNLKVAENLLREKKELFDKVYTDVYIAYAVRSARAIKNFDMQKASEQAERILESLNISPEVGIKDSYERKLYMTAIGENGILDYSAINNYAKVVQINDNGQSSEHLMQALRDKLLEYGYRITVFNDVLDKNIIDFIEITKLDILLKRSKVDRLPPRESEIAAYYLAQAGEALAKSKTVHRELEKMYIANMDFEGLDKRTQQLIDEISLSL